MLQRHLDTAHVVKVFNNITFWHLRALARPAGATDRSTLPIAGDDLTAKAAVAAFLDAIAMTAWTPERLAPVGAASRSVRAGSSYRTGG